MNGTPWPYPVTMDADVLADVEGDALAIYRMGGFDPDDTPSTGQLCRKVLGVGPQYSKHLRTEADSCLLRGQWRIFVRPGIGAERARWLVGHELAEWWYRRIGYVGADVEERCDALGAALVAPARAVREAWRTTEDAVLLAALLSTTQSIAHLRVGEVLGFPTALVRRGRIIVRGEEWGWPSERELLRPTDPRLLVVKITDESKRHGLRAA